MVCEGNALIVYIIMILLFRFSFFPNLCLLRSRRCVAVAGVTLFDFVLMLFEFGYIRSHGCMDP